MLSCTRSLAMKAPASGLTRSIHVYHAKVPWPGLFFSFYSLHVVYSTLRRNTGKGSTLALFSLFSLLALLALLVLLAHFLFGSLILDKISHIGWVVPCANTLPGVRLASELAASSRLTQNACDD